MECLGINMGLSKGGSLGYEVPQSNAMRRYRCQSQIYRLMILKKCQHYVLIAVDDKNCGGRPMRRKFLILRRGDRVRP